MRNKTRGTQITKVLTAASVDTTSADWIVEAPSLCDDSATSAADCALGELANFGTTRFAHASATSRYGHTGSISDSHWSRVKISISGAPASGGPRVPPGFVRDQTVLRIGASATPSTLNPAGDSFAVTYAAAA
jgi:hypothetical protein